MVRRPPKPERRRQILAAARRVFGRHGYSGARMIDIAGEAGVGKGTLYEHFSSKEDLFAELVLSVLRETLEFVRRTTTHAADPEKALRNTIAYLVTVGLVENLDLYRLFFDFWGVAAGSRHGAQDQLREVATTFRSLIADVVRRGQASGTFRPEADPDLFAHALCAAVDGLSLQIVVTQESIDLEAYARHIQEMSLRGLSVADQLHGASILQEGTK
jgi:TetR/AcrR family fatty acid metabolism transcriptional regulator